MKKAICIYLTIVLVLTGCGNLKNQITGKPDTKSANQLIVSDNKNSGSELECEKCQECQECKCPPNKTAFKVKCIVISVIALIIFERIYAIYKYNIELQKARDCMHKADRAAVRMYDINRKQADLINSINQETGTNFPIYLDE